MWSESESVSSDLNPLQPTSITRQQAQAVVDALVDHAVVAEMLLGAAGGNEAEKARRAAEAAESEEYLGGRVRYEKDRLVDEAEEGVMMEWEAPLMEAHAGLLCGDAGDRDVVNVGFGMVRICGWNCTFGVVVLIRNRLCDAHST